MPVRRCRCRNFVLNFEIKHGDMVNSEKLSKLFSDLVIDEQSVKPLALYPETHRDVANNVPLCVEIDPETFELKSQYEGMKATDYRLIEELPSVEVSYCANCKTTLCVRVEEDLYIVPNILCEDEEIPKTWPMRTDKPGCIKYSKKFDILYYDEDDIENNNGNDMCFNDAFPRQISTENGGNSNIGTSSGGSSVIGSSLIAAGKGLRDVGAGSVVSSLVMKSMRRVRDSYESSLKKDIQKRCEALASKLDKNLKELLSDSEEAIVSIVNNARMNSERAEVLDICPLYNEISSSSSSVQLQTPVLSGCTMSDDGALSLTPEGFNTVEKPHGLPGRTADTDAKIKIAKMGSYIRNSFDVRQRGIE